MFRHAIRAMPRATVERIAPGLLYATLSRFMLGAAITGARAGEVVSDDALLCCKGFGAGHLDSPAFFDSAKSRSAYAFIRFPSMPTQRLRNSQALMYFANSSARVIPHSECVPIMRRNSPSAFCVQPLSTPGLGVAITLSGTCLSLDCRQQVFIRS